MAAVPKGHVLALKESVDVSALAGREFILLGRNSGFRRACDRAFAACGFELAPLFESDNAEIARKAIELEVGVGLWPEFSWGRVDTHDRRLEAVSCNLTQRNVPFGFRAFKLFFKNLSFF